MESSTNAHLYNVYRGSSSSLSTIYYQDTSTTVLGNIVDTTRRLMDEREYLLKTIGPFLHGRGARVLWTLENLISYVHKLNLTTAVDYLRSILKSMQEEELLYY